MTKAVDGVSANEWRELFTDAGFLERLRSAAAMPRTEHAIGLLLVFREIGTDGIRLSRVYSHDLAVGRSATPTLYEDIPELYSDPILFIVEARGLPHGPPLPTHDDLQSLLTFVSSKGFTQMPLGLWLHQPAEGEPIALFMVQWRGYPSLDEWSAMEAAFANTPAGDAAALVNALNATGIIRAHADTLPPEDGTLSDLRVAERFAYELEGYGHGPGAYMRAPE